MIWATFYVSRPVRVELHDTTLHVVAVEPKANVHLLFDLSDLDSLQLASIRDALHSAYLHLDRLVERRIDG